MLVLLAQYSVYLEHSRCRDAKYYLVPGVHFFYAYISCEYAEHKAE